MVVLEVCANIRGDVFEEETEKEFVDAELPTSLTTLLTPIVPERKQWT